MTKKIFLPLVATMIFVTSIFMGPTLAVSQVHAQSTTNTGDKVQDGLTDIGAAYPAGAKQERNLKDVIRKVINWALYFAAIIAVIFIIIGGFMYITSAGDPGKATKGRTTLVNALIGLTIIVLSYLIVQIVYNFLINRT